MLLAVLGCLGCGSAHDRPAGQSTTLSGDALDAWEGGEAAAPAPETAIADGPGAAPVIELAGGGRLESFTALVVFDGGGDPVCALYRLRATSAGLEEGRTSIECPAGGLAAAAAAQIRYTVVEEPRRGQLASALEGARAVAAEGGGGGALERISVRVVTDRATVEGPAAPASWPPVADEPEPVYPHQPRNLSELYEAVMYPHRYARR